MNIQAFIKENLLDINGNPSSVKKKWWFRNNPHSTIQIVSELSKIDVDSNTPSHLINEAFYRVLTGVYGKQCKMCGSPTKFQKLSVGYADYCSVQCTAKLGGSKNAEMSLEKIHAAAIKRKQTNLQKYGVEHVLQNKEIVDSLKSNRKQKDYDTTINSFRKKFPTAVDIESHKFWENECKKHHSLRHLSDSIDVWPSTLHRFFDKIGFEPNYPKSSSGGERELFEFVKSLCPDAVQNDRKVLGGKEIDILIPSKNIGIEFDGLYFHKNKDQTTKQKLGLNINIQILFFFEDEWYEKQDICKSIIKAKLGLLERKIYARKTTKDFVPQNIAKQFMNANHIAGYAVAKQHIGLFYENELVAVASIGESRFKKELELIRFCTAKNTSVIGGLTKILKGIGTIYSYADKRFSPLCAAYGNIGILESETSVGYFWCKGSKRYSRFKFQKHKLKDFVNYSEQKTESEIMEENGYWKVYDCGNWKYKIEI